MKRVFFFILFLFISKTFFAQKVDSIPFRKNVLYGELLGNGIGYSVNYERQIVDGEKGFTAIRIGLNMSNDGTDILTVCPVLVTHVFNKNSDDHFELGGGVSFSTFLIKKTHHFDGITPLLTANCMYRYQKPKGKFVFRIGWTPIYWGSLKDTPEFSLVTVAFLLMPGISFGYTF